ncbi:MAG: SMP-30/gluconolactonase/LRE family protein [Bryobacteraceae bacterium]|nr:SMP-30/gluconolactonase/LRE family protein [Bryobacteraceae bacterium]
MTKMWSRKQTGPVISPGPLAHDLKTSLSRRRLLGLGLASSVAGVTWAADGYPVRETSFVSYDPSFNDLFVDLPKPPGSPNVAGPLIDRIASGFRWAEGPVWYEDALLFVDPRLNAIFRIREQAWGHESGIYDYASHYPLDIPPPQTQVGYGPNGLGVDNQGRLIVAEHTLRQVARREANGTRTILASHWEGKRLNSPNDFVVRRSDGSIYFTDPGYGIDRTPGAAGVEIDRQLTFQGIYRIAPNGSLHMVADNANRPNGLALSVDETVLYVNDSAAPPDRLVRAYDVRPDGSLANHRVFVDMNNLPAGGPDGNKVDARGNLWVAGLQEDPAGPIRVGNVLVYNPAGRLLGKILLPERALNVGFGGADWKTLYITATTSVYRVKTTYGGIPHPTTRTQGPPAITATGIINASPRGAAISPGSIVEIYGSNLAIASCPSAPPWPTQLSCSPTRVSVGGSDAALLYISPTQINAQIPSGLAPGAVSLTIFQGSAQSNTISLTLAR